MLHSNSGNKPAVTDFRVRPPFNSFSNLTIFNARLTAHNRPASWVGPVKRKRLVQALELMIQQDVARAILYQQINTSCWHPYLKGYLRATNGIYTHNRMEDVWLDK